MGWICLPNKTTCTVSFYSVSEDIEYVATQIWGFITNLSPGFIFVTFLVVIGVIIIYLLYSVKVAARRIKNG